MQPYETHEYKQKIVTRLCTMYDAGHYSFDKIDQRLQDYYTSLTAEPDAHNLYELLAAVRFMEKWDKYQFDIKRVQRIIKLGETLTFSTTEGRKNIHLSPVQIFQFANIYGPQETLQDGTKRRLCTNFILMVPRKFGKTTMLAIPAIDDYLFGDSNAMVSIGSNTDRQALILFKIIKDALQSIDTRGRMKFTTHSVRWKERKGTEGRESTIESLSGGGQTKDGWFGSLHLQDEYGSAKYVNGHSDAASLYQVMVSSMGPRKEPLSGIITTAGRVMDGPFQPMLEQAKAVLRGEVQGDQQFAHIFQPDAWEMDEASAALPSVWKKVQPHLGVTVQPDYYARYYKDAQLDREAFIEFNTKLLNKFVSDNVEEWISAQKIIEHQVQERIDTYIDSDDDDWQCFIGCDFSKGQDLCDMTYLCYNVRTQEYFLDCDAWITEETYNQTAKHPLYKMWADQKHLRVCPGAVISADMVVERLEEIYHLIYIKRIGYDRYDSLRFVNLFKVWMADKGLNPKEIDQTIVPVSQLNSTFNAPCQELLDLVNWNPQVLYVSNNPLIPWAFGNCYLEADGMGNLKPMKSLRSGKIDPVIGALEGLWLQEHCEE